MARIYRMVWVVVVMVGLTVFVGQAKADSSYIVQPGDTLYRIALQFGTSVQAIAAANGITNPGLIYAGQRLTIPGVDAAPPATPPPVVPPVVPPTTPPTTAVYVVKPGDTLFRIASQFGVPMQSIAQANNIVNYGLIYVGQQLVIPGGTGPQTPVTPPVVPQPTPPPAPPPVVPPAAPVGGNRFINGSFEGGWYHPNGVPELQIPEGWVFEWDEGPTGFGSAAWDVWMRPEVRVLPASSLPAQEQGLFIFDGNQTVKIFKGNGPVSFRLFQTVTLPAGMYQMRMGVFPDLVVAYEQGVKVRPSDPNAGDVRFMVGNGGSGWLAPVFGQKNEMVHTFTLSAPQTIRLGLAVRGKYAFQNDGWFLDQWELVKVG
jgi:LysM repeat protein